MKGCVPPTKEEWTLIYYSVRGRYWTRTKALMMLGRKTGFRISELLSLRVRDLINEGQTRRTVTVERQNMKGGKAGKADSRTIPLHVDVIKPLLAHYEFLKERGEFRSDQYFFQSQAKGNRAITRQRAWADFREPIKRRRVEGKLGTHGLMRKMFAMEKLDYLREQWEPGKEVPVHTLQRCTGHKTIDALMSYIEFADNDVEDAILNS